MLNTPVAETPPRAVEQGADRTLSVALHAAAFLGAFLLFQVQPLLGKAVLPWFGGAAAVWTVVMLFFQTVLVAGYAVVFLTTRFLEPRSRSYVFIICVVAAAALLPILPGASWKPDADVQPVWHIVSLLTACVGGPYFVLSMTGPLVQDWFYRALQGRSPYRLYALSNFGSLCGLLTYPLVVEPFCSLSTQSTIWSGAFVAYAISAIYCAWRVRGFAAPAVSVLPAKSQSKQRKKATEAEVRDVGGDVKPTVRRILAWCALAGAGSLMLLATTNHLCQDVASVPLFWIVPLAVYLTTFILCFEYPAAYRRLPYAALTLVLVPLASWRFTGFAFLATANLAMLFVVCMLFHGELVRGRPSPRFLSAYYLCIAVGGALGGLFVGVVAPVIYNRYWEWMIGTFGVMLFAGVAAAASLTNKGRLQSRFSQGAYVAVLLGGLAFVVFEHKKRFDPEEIDSARNFYGVITISAGRDKFTGDVIAFFMRSGTTGHGGQVFGDNRSALPITYYAADTGIGVAIARKQQTAKECRIGVIGLGTGTLAAYGRKDDIIRFYELNPAVIQLCERHFKYLQNSMARCEVVLGDARLSLEHEAPQAYDVLVLDAFSSDAIPTHLLTAEAFEVYLRHLAADGILAIHVSNKHLDLAPVVAAAAERFSFAGLKADTSFDPFKYRLAAEWILLTRDPRTTAWKGLADRHWKDLKTVAPVRLWTDDYSNILAAWR